MRYGLREATFRYRGFVGGLFATLAGLAVIATSELTPASFTIPAAAIRDVLAWSFFIVGGFFRVWSTLYIGGKKNHCVVNEGPYSICRNPLYVGSFCLFLSSALFFRSLVVLVAAFVVIAYYWLAVIPAEERKLQKVLGQAYGNYCRAVPRLIPSASQFRTRAQIPVNVAALRREARRLLLWVWIPLFAQLIYG